MHSVASMTSIQRKREEKACTYLHLLLMIRTLRWGTGRIMSISIFFILSISSIYLGTSMEKALTRFGSPSRSDTFFLFY